MSDPVTLSAEQFATLLTQLKPSPGALTEIKNAALIPEEFVASHTKDILAKAHAALDAVATSEGVAVKGLLAKLPLATILADVCSIAALAIVLLQKFGVL